MTIVTHLKWVLSHIWNEYCHTCDARATHVHEYCHTSEMRIVTHPRWDYCHSSEICIVTYLTWVLSHISNEYRHTSEWVCYARSWVFSDIWMRHVTHMMESCQKPKWSVCCLWVYFEFLIFCCLFFLVAQLELTVEEAESVEACCCVAPGIWWSFCLSFCLPFLSFFLSFVCSFFLSLRKRRRESRRASMWLQSISFSFFPLFFVAFFSFAVSFFSSLFFFPPFLPFLLLQRRTVKWHSIQLKLKYKMTKYRTTSNSNWNVK